MGRNILQLNTTQIATIRAISLGNSDVKYAAKGILSFALGEDYADYIKHATASFGNTGNGNASLKAAGRAQTMTLSPNPTQGLLNIQFAHNDLSDDAQLIITDLYSAALGFVQMTVIARFARKKG